MADVRGVVLRSGAEAAREQELVARHRAGDEQAFLEIYREHAPMVFNLTLRLSGNRELAQDLSQEVLLRVFRSLRSFAGRSSLKTWIYRICVNHCRTRLTRRRADERDGASVDLEALLVDPARGPEDRLIAADAQRVVARALLEVDAVYREAVVLRDLEGLSYQEIARVLRVRVGTVRSRIARGRDQLRGALRAALPRAGAGDARQPEGRR